MAPGKSKRFTAGKGKYKASYLAGKTRMMRGLAAERRDAMMEGMQLAAAARSMGGRGGRNIRNAGFLGLELKFLDQFLLNQALVAPTDAAGAELDPTIGSVLCIGHPAQGDGPSDRDGRTYVVKSITLEGSLYVAAQTNQTAADIAGQCRFYLVQDTQTNAAQLNSEDVFTNPNGSALTACSALRNLLHIKRFRILDEVKIDIEQPTMTYDGTNVEQGGFQRSFQLRWFGNVKVVATNTTGVVATVDDNSFHVVGYCTNTSTAPVVSYNCRTRFMG